jgi:KUP system potassium uptake protein
MPMHPANHPRKSTMLGLAIGAIGVVFGDIGTSPLYTLQVAAADLPDDPRVAHAEIHGTVSLIFWALVLAVSLKYVTFVMSADNRGEGGILALLALLPTPAAAAGDEGTETNPEAGVEPAMARGSARATGFARRDRPVRAPWFSMGIIALLVIGGAALLFGDGMITPAISVLSALEGLKLTTPGFAPYVVPLTCGVLFALFSIQRHGTGSVGKLFGPVMVLWFLTLGALGLKEVVLHPEILVALSPHWIVRYFARHGIGGLRILGVVVLAITGGEALYADMGHFGARPIRVSWFAIVFPALALSYLGQGAHMLHDRSAYANPFFALVPPGIATYALVVLASLATVIASQALITGVFSLTHQAVQLGFFPRVAVRHTSSESEGQIYVPVVNWGLAIACITLVLAFRESSRLAAAYGIAVSGTMAITSVVFFEVTRKVWKWPLWRAVPLLVLFLSFDLPFLGANLLKFGDGGYVPIGVGALFFAMMLIWHRGHELLIERAELKSLAPAGFVDSLAANVARVPGTAIYLSETHGVPHVLAMQCTRVRSLMERVLVVTILVEHEPTVSDDERIEVEPLDRGFTGVTVHFGFMEDPRVTRELERAVAEHKLEARLDDATYYVGHETVVGGAGGKMGAFAETIFAFLARNANSRVDHFGLPLDHVVELGVRIDL